MPEDRTWKARKYATAKPSTRVMPQTSRLNFSVDKYVDSETQKSPCSVSVEQPSKMAQ
jgi:hypothetical protein